MREGRSKCYSLTTWGSKSQDGTDPIGLVVWVHGQILTSLIDKQSRVLVANLPLGVIIMILGGACGYVVGNFSFP